MHPLPKILHTWLFLSKRGSENLTCDCDLDPTGSTHKLLLRCFNNKKATLMFQRERKKRLGLGLKIVAGISFVACIFVVKNFSITLQEYTGTACVYLEEKIGIPPFTVIKHKIAPFSVIKHKDGRWEGRDRNESIRSDAMSQEKGEYGNASGEARYSEYLGFLRISKTASTSVMNFLSASHGSNLHNLNDITGDDQRKMYNCYFTPFTNASSSYHGSCPHPMYGFLKQKWYDSLSSIETKSGVDHTFYFHPFTMIRDPFDRMVSFFYYMQYAIPKWAASEKQDELILNDDFFGWLDQLQREGRVTEEIGHPFQFAAVHDDLDTAIGLISGDKPEIFVTLTDCVATSLRLLAAEKPQFFDPDRVETFIQSPHSTGNKHKDEPTVKPFNRTLARMMHKEIFPEDWKFYNAALLQMKRSLVSSSGMDVTEPAYLECMDRIDAKILESEEVIDRWKGNE